MQDNKFLDWQHGTILVIGIVLGLIVAYYVTLIPFDFSTEIQKAQKMGITSLTIQAGYPKTNDIITYLAILGFPIICSIGIWLLWARQDRKTRLQQIWRDTASCSQFPKDRVWKICLATAILFYWWISFNINYFYVPNFSKVSGSWPFFGEEGANLAWVQTIINGGVYGKDFFCLYGPMLIYPQVWFMQLFGMDVVVARVYSYLLNFIAYTLVLLFFYKVIRLKTLFIMASIVYLTVFPSLQRISPNNTYLRFVLGVVPILLAYCYWEKPRRYLLFLIGIVAGQSLLLSQEAGLCSIITLLVSFLVYQIGTYQWRQLRNELAIIGLGCLISLLPLLLYMGFHGALWACWYNIYDYPKLVTLGFACYPFTSFQEFLQRPFGELHCLQYLIIFIYIFTAVFTIPQFIVGMRHPRLLLQMSLLIYGIFTFRAALGRSDIGHTHIVAPTSVLLLVMAMDNLLCAQRHWLDKSIKAILLTMVITLFFSQKFIRADMKPFVEQMVSWENKVVKNIRYGHQLLQIRRGGVYFDSATASSLADLHHFLESATKPGDYVYFFPHEAAYYFLLDRTNPTRYAIAYFAITTQHRLELIDDLEEKKPDYIVYTLNTWRIDNIHENILVPEVMKYLQQKYKMASDYGNFVILKRKKN